MKSIYKGTAIIAILFIVVSCSFSKSKLRIGWRQMIYPNWK